MMDGAGDGCDGGVIGDHGGEKRSSSGGKDHRRFPYFHLSRYLTPAAGPAEEGEHAVSADCSL